MRIGVGEIALIRDHDAVFDDDFLADGEGDLMADVHVILNH